MRYLVVFPILASCLLACPSKQTNQSPPPPTQTGTSTTSMKGADPSDRDQVDGDGVVRRGAQLSEQTALTVASVRAQADSLAGKTVKVTGEVDSVCTKKGCWFVIKEGEDSIRITAKDYGFFVPAKAQGMVATIEGELSVKELDQATIDHYKAEGATVKDAKEVGIVAAGLEMKKKG